MVEVFNLLKRREGRGIQDSVGLAGMFYAVKSAAQLERLLAAFDHACLHSQRALEAERRKDWGEAFRQWGIVFNGEFPKR